MELTPLPKPYSSMTTSDALERIREYKRALGGRLAILGHHYQCDAIVGVSDFVGDSLELSQIAAKQRAAEYIVFCGVHFMAESADVLAGPHQKVLLPDVNAGCPMADMARIEQVEDCWRSLTERMGGRRIVPITYVNSTAAIKAFCGRNGGTCCTSSNSTSVFRWVWDRDPEAVILFMPDEHLGRNTAYDMGVGLDEMAVWDPNQADGGVSTDTLKASRMILWKGYCTVHQEFTAEQIKRVRKDVPGVKVIVHPECCFDVVQGADESGSTSAIIKTIRGSQRGSRWAVGTEIHLVRRLAEEMAGKGVEVRCLSETACRCETMGMVDPQHLAQLLSVIDEHIRSGGRSELVNRVIVADTDKGDARKAMERMLEITAAAVKLYQKSVLIQKSW